MEKNNEIVSVIIPVFNEERTISNVINSVLKYVDNLLEIVIVDDGSNDSTKTIVSRLTQKNKKVVLICHEKNSGKTAALRTGFASSKGNIVIIQDADLEYNPEEINSVIEPILLGKADIVYGSRFLTRKMARVLYFKHYLANKTLTFISNLLTDLNFSDIETGYKAFRGDIIKNMTITSSGFGFEIEVTAKIAKINFRIYEVPISYYGRTYAEGKKIGLKDGIMALYYLLKYNIFTSKNRSYAKGYLIN